MVQAWPVYGLGILLVFLGFGALHRWLQGLTGRRREAPGGVLAASAVAFVVGSSVLSVAILIDSEQVRVEQTRLFTYHMSVVPSGAGPVTVRLPAPSDPRVLTEFNRTNGTSTVRIVGSGASAYVEVLADGPASFEARRLLEGSPLNRTLVGVAPRLPPARGNLTAVVPITLTAGVPDGVSAEVNLTVRFSEYCAVTEFAFSASVPEGTSSVEGLWTVTRTGACP